MSSFIHINPINQLLQSLVYCNLLAIMLVGFFFVFVKIYKGKGNDFEMPFSNALFIMLSLYLTSVVAMTLVPLKYNTTGVYARAALNLSPLTNTLEALFNPAKKQHRLMATDVVQNIVGNIVLFIPMGILLPCLSERYQSFKKILLIAACCSLSIEVLQFISRWFGVYRQSDIDDVIFNTLGATIGYLVYKIFKKRREASLSNFY